MRESVAKPWYSRLNLRMRVALTFAGLGLVVSACVALVALHFSDAYVDRLSTEMLRAQSEYVRERFVHEGKLPQLQLHHFTVYSRAAGKPPPPRLAGLATGMHEIHAASGTHHVAVYAVAQDKLYVVFDIAEERAREQHLSRDLLLLVWLGTALSAWLGWLWAGRAIEPVRRLAQQVEVLEPPRHGANPLAPGYAADEVGTLAQAFDRYQEKLYEYVRRERAFTADASHELRTPLAVIRGALEVMLDGDCNAADAARLKRMQRGSDELRDLLDALLVLARSEEDKTFVGHTSDLHALTVDLLRERADALHEKHVRVRHTGIPDVEVAAPPRVLGVVLSNLLRAATQFADDGDLDIDVAAASVSIAYRGPASVDAVSATTRGTERADRVLGLGMVRRVCERWGWRIDEDAADGGDRRFVLYLSTGADFGRS